MNTQIADAPSQAESRPDTFYDFFNLDPASLNDPFTFWDWVRSQGPAYRDPSTDVYIVTGYGDILSIVKDPKRYSSCVCATGHLTKFPGKLEGVGAELQQRIDSWREQNGDWQLPFLSYDGDLHTRMRRLIAPLFSPSRLTHLQNFIREEATALIDAFADQGSCNFQESFADPLPMLVMSELFNLAEEFRDNIIAQVRENKIAVEHGGMAAIGSPRYDAGDENLRAAAERGEQFFGYMQNRRQSPTGDVLSEIVNGKFFDTHQQPELDQLLPVVQQIFGAGTDTTSLTLRTGMRILATNSSLADELRAEPELVKNFVEELLRCHSSAKVLFRLSLEDTLIGGVPVPARSIICLSFQAGNRDPAQFPLPHNFDIRRSNMRTHLAFGGTGDPHGCIGLHVSRLELNIGFELLLKRLKNIRMKAGAPPPHQQPSYILYGPSTLEIEYEPA